MYCERALGIWRCVVRGAASKFGTRVDGVYGRGVRSRKESLNGARGTLHCAFSRVRAGAGGGHFVLEAKRSGGVMSCGAVFIAGLLKRSSTGLEFYRRMCKW